VFTKLKGAVMERLLEAEISEHVGHEKQGRRRSSNSRNGHSPKVGQTETGPIEIQGRPLGGLRSSGPSCGSVRRPQLGVRVGDVSAVDAEVYGLPRVAGAEIGFVQPDSPAARADLEPGDVIVAIDDDEIADSTQLTTSLARRDPGDEVELTLYRGGRQRKTTVELGQFERPETARNAEPRRTPDSVLGFAVQPLTPQVARQLGYGGAEGVVVTDVAQLGAAARAGLRPGMRMLAVNGRAVSTVAELAAATEGIAAGDVVSLRVEVPELGQTLINYRARG
jgi:serine protease Do